MTKINVVRVAVLSDPERFQRLLDLASSIHQDIDENSEGVVDTTVLLPSLGMLRMIVTELEEMIYTAFGDERTIPVDQARTKLFDYIQTLTESTREKAGGMDLIDALIDACSLKAQRITNEDLRRFTDSPIKDFPRPMGVPKNVH